MTATSVTRRDHHTEWVTMPDGCVLATEVWLPETPGPHPALVQRLPYGREVASGTVLPTPGELARLGYAVVVQDVRGTGASGGDFVPFADTADGVSTIEWVAGQAFCDGRVITYGFSYQGHNQLQVAARRPRGLMGIVPMMTPTDPHHFVYESGVRKWDFMALWAAQLSGLGGDPRTFDLSLPPDLGIGANPPAWYSDWLAHSGPDEYWRLLSPDLTAITVPILTVLGYADVFATGTDRLVRETGAHVVCGPWEHMPWGTKLGDLELGPAAGPRPAIDSFLTFVRDVFAGQAPALPPAQWYEVGGTWRAGQWPPPATRVTLHGLTREGANSRHSDGRLTGERPGDETAGSVILDDTGNPVPGKLEPYPDLSAIEDRRDVVCFTSAPVHGSIRIAGTALVEVDAATDATDPSGIDVIASLCVVDRAGLSRQIAIGAHHLGAGSGRVEMALSPIAWVLAPGERLRLDLSCSRFPRYGLRPGPTTARLVTLRQAHLGIPVVEGELV